MAHDASNNNPVKESMHALIGAVMLLVIIGGIAVFAWLRPAGNHALATASATEAGKKLEEALVAIEKPAETKPVADTTSTDTTADATATATDPATTDTTAGTDQATDANVEASASDAQAQAEQTTKEDATEQDPTATAKTPVAAQ